jgi:hypothetical protein
VPTANPLTAKAPTASIVSPAWRARRAGLTDNIRPMSNNGHTLG